jgi:hypothetical protein
MFNDVTLGDIDMDCANTVDCFNPSSAIRVESKANTSYKPTHNAAAGYELAAGLGTINAGNLVNAWGAATSAPS